MLNFREVPKLIIRAILLMSALLTNTQAFAQSEWARIENNKTTLGEPVLLDIHVENTSSRDVEAHFGGDGEQNILLEVIAPNGERYGKPEAHLRNGPTFFGIVSLRSGEQFSESLLLNKWFKFDQIGTYQLRVKLRAAETKNGLTGAMLPLTLTLDVAAGDPRKLDAVCRSLLPRVKGSISAQDAQTAAEALSTIPDPVVVPFLEQAAKQSIHAGILIGVSPDSITVMRSWQSLAQCSQIIPKFANTLEMP